MSNSSLRYIEKSDISIGTEGSLDFDRNQMLFPFQFYMEYTAAIVQQVHVKANLQHPQLHKPIIIFLPFKKFYG
jgi:hypothetical protein